MNASDLFKELGLGDSDMESAREWVNYKHFSKTVPDVLTLSEYLDTVYKKAVTMDAKPHQPFVDFPLTKPGQQQWNWIIRRRLRRRETYLNRESVK